MTPGGVCGNAVTSERALTFAPPRTRAVMTSGRLSRAAHISAVVPVRCLGRVGFGAGFEEKRHGFGASRARRQHQTRLAVAQRGIGRLQVGAARKERLQRLGVAGPGGQRHRRHAVAVRDVRARPCSEQGTHQRRIARMGGPVKRGGPVRFGDVDVGAPLGHRAQRSRAAGLHGRDERRRVGGERRPADQRRFRPRLWPRRTARPPPAGRL